MKKKTKFELVIEKEKEIDGEKRYEGYVAAEGLPKQGFANLPIEMVWQHFLSTAEFWLKEMEK